MNPYERSAVDALERWRREILRPPSRASVLASSLQKRITRAIPEKVHQAITTAMKQMIRAILAGAGLTTARPDGESDLETLEAKVLTRINFYQTAAAAEGAVTGAGGILLGLADFPLWLALKIKMLFEIASLYGHDMGSQEERVFILRVFELTFSRPARQAAILRLIESWEAPGAEASHAFSDDDWRTLQQEYRDALDVPKLLQLLPGIGAPVGAAVNHRLTQKLAVTAMNAYRMRRLTPPARLGIRADVPPG